VLQCISFPLSLSLPSAAVQFDPTQVKMCKKAVEPLEKWPDYLTDSLQPYSLESTNGFFRIYIQNADEKKKKKNAFPKKKG
jgi:hypothetical protein